MLESNYRQSRFGQTPPSSVPQKLVGYQNPEAVDRISASSNSRYVSAESTSDANNGAIRRRETSKSGRGRSTLDSPLLYASLPPIARSILPAFLKIGRAPGVLLAHGTFVSASSRAAGRSRYHKGSQLRLTDYPVTQSNKQN
jgi:hypothetical protein